MKRILGFLASLAVALVAATPAQEPSTDVTATSEMVFSSLKQSISTLKVKVNKIDTTNLRLIDQVDQSVIFLQDEVVSGQMGPGPETYLKSLALDADLLKNLASRREAISIAERASLTEGLQVVTDDLEIKVGHLKTPTKGPTLVELTVRARSSGKEVDDCEVWYVQKGWFGYPDVYKRFDRPTNQSKPPKMFLPPGNYFIWLSKPPIKTERQPLTVGGDGSSRREIELLFPNEN